MKRLTTSVYIEKAEAIHGDHYDYSKLSYSGAKDNVTIICKVHGEFVTTAQNHLRSKECILCAENSLTSKISLDATSVGLIYVGKGTKKRNLYRFKSCGHRQEIAQKEVLSGSFRCRCCVLDKKIAFAAELGLTCLEQFDGSNKSTYRFNDCGHERKILPQNIKKDQFKCAICYEAKIEHVLKANELELIAKKMEKGVTYYMVIFRMCGHEHRVSHSNLISGKFRCSRCHYDNKEKKALSVGITLLGKGNKPGTWAISYIKCGHTDQISDSRLNRYDRSSQCRECINNRHLLEASEAGVTILGDGHNGQYRLYRFNECGHQQEIDLKSVRLLSFLCRICNESTRDLPSKIYLLEIKFHEFSWLKLGYARSLKSRYRFYGLHPSSQITELFVTDVGTGAEARKIETRLHKELQKNRLDPELMRNYHRLGGFTECYPLELRDKIMAKLQKLPSFSN